MNEFSSKFSDFFKKEIIFSISLILAILSCFFVKPTLNYSTYINWDTIILLFVIMLIVEILRNLSIFEILVRKLLVKVKNTRYLVLFLVFTCFFSSIFITNDVSLIIFVPFAILALRKVDRDDLIIITVSMQTIVPYIIVSVVFLVVVSLFVPKEGIVLPEFRKIDVSYDNFLKRVFIGIDYYLLLTFIALFVLIGNLENIPFFNALFTRWIVGNEVLIGVAASQVISNVPAAMLLSGFSSNYGAIIIGINIGGFGTLIASMANLISYKILVREFRQLKVKYLIVFTVLNVVLLVILLGVYAFA